MWLVLVSTGVSTFVLSFPRRPLSTVVAGCGVKVVHIARQSNHAIDPAHDQELGMIRRRPTAIELSTRSQGKSSIIARGN